MLIDGKKVAQDILAKLKQEVSALSFVPVFCDVLVGDDPVSAQYVRMKGKRAEEAGIAVRTADFPDTISTEELVIEIKKLNQEKNMRGLIVQLPLPKHIDTQTVLDAIDPAIDVDAIGTENTNLFYKGTPRFIFPTAAAAVELLDSVTTDLANKKIVVAGRGKLVGKPVTFLLEQRKLNVTTIHSSTENPDALLREADVIISAVGKGKLIHAGNIKKGAILIDAGTSESSGGVVGDVDTESVKDIASYISPVPGGVGPVTVAMLLKNVVISSKFEVRSSQL